MQGMFRYLATKNGRVTRGEFGIALIVLGVLIIDGPVGWVVAVIGLLPVLAALFDVCLFAPLFGLPFQGAELRVINVVEDDAAPNADSDADHVNIEGEDVMVDAD